VLAGKLTGATTLSASAASTRGWLFGPAPDLLLGCGVGYLAIALLHLVFGASLASVIPGGLLILVFAVPHYGATLLRVYESSEDRSRYRFFALHSTIALVVLFAVSLHAGLIGSLLLTVYLTWSPWHYTAQNYGIALMLLARRGVTVVPATKRWIHASFVCCYGLVFLALHGAQPGASFAPVSYGGASIQLLSLGIPHTVVQPALVLLMAAYGVSLLVSLAKLFRLGPAAALAPAMLVVATQAFWFSVPVALRMSDAIVGAPGPESPFSAYGFVWVAAGHSVQYLWITTYYSSASGTGTGKAAFLGKAALAGFAVWTLPGLLFAPGLVGDLSYDSGLALLVASIVNLHHFVLDGAIWKLRDRRVASVLLRATGSEGSPSPPAGRGLVRRAFQLAGAVSIAIALLGFWESEVGYRRALAANDFDRAERALERFAWIGRDGAQKRNEVARGLASHGFYAVGRGPGRVRGRARARAGADRHDRAQSCRPARARRCRAGCSGPRARAGARAAQRTGAPATSAREARPARRRRRGLVTASCVA